MDLEKQIISFKRVYGDLQTTPVEKAGMVVQVKELAKEFTKYGIAVNDTIALAAKAAATGATGADLIAQTTEATRLATLGQIDYQQALDATISLQTAFGISSKELATTTDFLNAVENQTVTSLDDITQAIPLVAPVIKGLGGDVKDLAIFMTAMREGGVSANEGANALKSGLASLINPTKAAREQLQKVGIDIDAILSTNKGDLRGLVTEFGAALGTLDKFSRQQTLAKMFGKYQFARLGALFQNISKDGTQASRVIDLTTESAKDLAKLSEGELGQIEEAVGVKFTAAVEKLKVAIAPIGEAFLKIATPIIDFATKLADKFNELPDGMKSLITWGVAIGGVVIPAVVMIVGLFANFLGQMVKMGNTFRMFMQKVRGGGSALQYLESEELDAMAASASLEGQTTSLTGALNVQRAAVVNLARAYSQYVAGAEAAAAALPQGFRAPAGPAPGRRVRRFATGGFVAGRGNKDTEPALLTPGEFVVNKKAANQNADILSAMNAGTLSRLSGGSTNFAHIGSGMSIGVGSLSELMQSIEGGFTAGAKRFVGILASQFGNQLKANVYPSLGITTGAGVNRRLATPGNNPVTKEEFLADWDQQGIARWNESLKRAGLKADDVADDLTLLEQAMRKEIASLEDGAVINDDAMKKIYDSASSQLPKGSRLKKSFDGLERTFKEIRVNIKKSLLGAHGIATTAVGNKFGAVIGGKTYRESDKVKPTRAGTGATPEQLKAAGATGMQVGEALDGGARAAVGAASPAKDGEKLTSDYVDGMSVGAKKNSAEAEAAGATVKEAFDEGATKGRRGRRGATRPQGPPGRYSNAGVLLEAAPQNPTGNGLTGRFAPGTMPATNNPELPVDPKQAKNLRQKMSGMAGKLGAGMFAMDGLLFGMSMMDNGVGEFAQKIMPAAFALQGIAMMKPMLMNPAGAVVAALAASAAAIWYFKSKSDEMAANAQKLSDSLIAGSRTVDKVGEFYGRKSLAKKQADSIIAQKADATPDSIKKAQDFVKSETGQAMREGLSEAMTKIGNDSAAKQFAANLGSMVLQGVMTPLQARSVAAAMGESLGNQQFGVNVNAKLKKLLGEDNENLLKKPLKLAIQIDRQNSKTVETLSADVSNLSAQMQEFNDPKWGDLGAIAINPVFGLVNSINKATLGWDNFVGSVARSARGILNTDDFEKVNENLQLMGSLAGNTVSQAYDNLTAAKARYKKISEDAAKIDEKDTKAKSKANAMARQAKEDLQTLTKSVKKQQDDLRKIFDKAGENGGAGQVSIMEGLRTSIDKKFEADPAMKMAWGLLQGNFKNVSSDIQFNLDVGVSSGELNPIALNAMFALAGGDGKAASIQIDTIVNSAGFDGANQLFIALSNVENQDLAKKIRIESVGLSEADIQNVTNGLNFINDLPSDIQKAIKVETWGILDMIKAGAAYQKLSDLKTPVTKKAVLKALGREDAKALIATWDTFAALPDSVTKTARYVSIQEYWTIYKQVGFAPNGQKKQGPGLGHNGDLVVGGNYILPETVTPPKETPSTTPSSTTPSGSDGGGGGTKEDPLKGYKDMWNGYKDILKMYTNIENVLKKIGSKKNSIEKALKSSSLGFNHGLVDEMRRAGMSEAFIADLVSKGYKEAKKIFDTLKKRGKLNVANMAMLVGKAGETVSNNRKSIREKQAQLGANDKLGSMGVSDEVRQSIAGDPEKAQQFWALWKRAHDNVKGGQKALDQFIKSETLAVQKAKELEEALNPQTIAEAYKSASDAILEAMDLEIAKIEDRNAKEFTANHGGTTPEDLEQAIVTRNAEITVLEHLIKKVEDLNAADEKRIDDLNRQKELIGRQIEQLERANEMDQRRIEDLRRQDELRQREADAINHDLELLARQEEVVRNAYQARIDALNEIAKVNDHILQSQQDQLSIGKALSEGDVYAAAEAAAQMQSNQVQYANQVQQDGLQQGMENAVNGLTLANGMTREQAEARLNTIKDQSYQTSLQIRDIEDQIYARTQQMIPLKDQQYALDQQIQVINDAIYQRNIEQKDIYQQQIDALLAKNEQAQIELDNLALKNAQDTEGWKAKKAALEREINLQNDSFNQVTNIREMTKSATAKANELASAWGAVATNAWNAAAAAGAAGAGTGTAAGKYAGGMIRKYATGSVVGDGARDSVLSMLTPGEFVVRKSMVDKYGESMFQQINQGSFSMPRYSAPASFSGAAPKAAKTSTNISAPVYNSYSVNVNASTNASADDIARTVIAKIKTIESSNIRRVNGY